MTLRSPTTQWKVAFDICASLDTLYEIVFAFIASLWLCLSSHDYLVCRYHSNRTANDKLGCRTSSGNKEVSGIRGDVLGFMCGDDKQTQNEERNASSLLKSPLGERLHIYSAARGLIAAVHLNQEETLSTTGRWRIHSYHFIILLFLKKTFLTHSVSPWLLLFHNIL